MTYNSDAGFAQVTVLLLQRLAFQLERFELDFKHFVLLLKRRQAVGQLLQPKRGDQDALLAVPGGGGRGGGGGGQRGG